MSRRINDPLLAAQDWIKDMREPGRSPRYIALNAEHARHLVNEALERVDQHVLISNEPEGWRRSRIKQDIRNVRENLMAIHRLADDPVAFPHGTVMTLVDSTHLAISEVLWFLSRTDVILMPSRAVDE